LLRDAVGFTLYFNCFSFATAYYKTSEVSEVSQSPNLQAPRIAVVDDDPELLKLIGMLLGRIGAESHMFADGEDILRYLETASPDLIIIDLMLPDINGYDILRHIRSQNRFDNVPVLILSARADPSSIRRGLDEGADGYVTKPYIANSLIDRVRLLLSQGRQSKPTAQLQQDDFPLD